VRFGLGVANRLQGLKPSLNALGFVAGETATQNEKRRQDAGATKQLR
jgi:hypothetical protein